MANTSKLNKLMAISPHVELIVRRLYRNRFFYNYLKKYNITKNPIMSKEIDFCKILDYLKIVGIGKGDILIVHSSFFSLIRSKLTPSQIISKLITLIGESGTLVMPVIRRYPESPPEKFAITSDISDIVFNYNVKESKVWTGVIPYTLMKMEDSVTSRFPLNTITAYGNEAEKMIQNELKEHLPVPNGVNSAWKYCADKNAWVISLGTDLVNSLTMAHTYEDLLKEKWPVKNWYRKKRFIITDGDYITEKTVLEKHPKWGMLHHAERTLCKDLINKEIMKSELIEGVLIESLRSKPLLDFLQKKNENQIGYPYFWVKRYL